MRIELGVVVVVVLGLAIGLWWTREEPSRATTERPKSAAAPVRPRTYVSPSRAPSARAESTRPALARRTTLEATDADPERRKLQEELWQYLRKFATDAKLDEAQWERFQQDLSDLAQIESSAWANGVNTADTGGILELSDELDRELEARCAAYMTQRQLAVLRFHFPAALVTRVRQLHYVPVVTPEL